MQLSEAMTRFFEVEIRNDHKAGNPPSKLDTAFSSLFQAPDDVVMDWCGGERDTLLGEINQLIAKYGLGEYLEDFLQHPHTFS
jgi:hypothetical protein